MRLLIAFFLCAITYSIGFSQGNFPKWNEDYAWGGASNDILMDILEVEKDYSIVAAGHTLSSNNQEVSDNTNGLSDYWVLKMDTNENIIFDHNFGGDTTELLAVLLETADNGYLLAGSSASGRNGSKSENSKGGFDFWLVKISETGVFQWDKTIGGNDDDFLYSATPTNDGGYILAGSSLSNSSGDKSDGNEGEEDYWIVKVNGTGNVVWDETFGGDSVDVAKNVQVYQNSIFVGGHSKSDSVGSKHTYNNGGYDHWIVELSTGGTLINQYGFGGIDDDFLEEMREHPHDAAFWVSGTSYSGVSGDKSSSNYGGSDVWVYIMGVDGVKGLDETFGSSSDDICKDMETSPEGSIIVGATSGGSGGSKSSGTQGVRDFWLFKVDTFGGKYWDRNYGGANEDSLEAIFIKCDRGILAGGHSLSGVSGDRTHYNRGSQDYWAFKLDVPTHPYFRASNICSGVPLNFYDESDVWPDLWLWDFDDPLSANNSSEDQHPIHTYSEAGVYNVKMTIKEGCQKDTTLTRTITVYDNTVMGNLELGDGFSVCEGTFFELYNKEGGQGDFDYLWNTGDTTDVLFTDSLGVYTVVMSDRNCSVVDSVEVGDCPTIFIPNTFTPNGDEINDMYHMKGFGIAEFELLIFDRWGELIYQSNDINEGWDGTYNGNKAQIDVYVFKVRYKGIGTLRKQKIGHISLIR